MRGNFPVPFPPSPLPSPVKGEGNKEGQPSPVKGEGNKEGQPSPVKGEGDKEESIGRMGREQLKRVHPAQHQEGTLYDIE